jgi:putative chitinase
MMIPEEALRAAMPGANAQATLFAAPLNAAMKEFAIDTWQRQAAFLAQIAHESNELHALEENLNYRPEAILATFNSKTTKRFTPEQAQQYGRTPAHPANQQMIANIAYAGRYGNGNVASGDGWLFRGVGLIQLTFRANHEACADYFGLPRSTIGQWLRTPEGACRSAARYWQQHGCNELADKDDALNFDRITVAINPARKGAAERVACWAIARDALKPSPAIASASKPAGGAKAATP